MMKDALIRNTRSICPVCGKNIPAGLCEDGGKEVVLVKTCPEHGRFSVPVWRGRMDLESWCAGATELSEGQGASCPENCGLCGEHESRTCCTLLEVTKRCNLRCAFCFADGGCEETDPSGEEMKRAIRDIAEKCGKPLLQFSGGEPTLRDDLPELVRYAKEAGCSYTQIGRAHV